MFSNEDELNEIVEWCVKSPGQAEKVAESGFRRIVEGRHRYVDRAREIVDEIG